MSDDETTSDGGSVATREELDDRTRDGEETAGGLPPVGPILGLFGLYVLTVVGGFALAQPFESAGVPSFEDPDNVANVGLIFVEILIVTAVFILIQRYGWGKQVLRVLILAVFGYAANLVVVGTDLPEAGILGPALAVAVFVALLVHPEWYVIDATAVLAGAAIIAQFGNGLGPLPTLIFLVGMAAYDAYAVYVSEHMQQLGGGVGELRLPMMYVVPPTLSFSMDDLGNPFEEDGQERDSEVEADDGPTPILLGLGDAIVPGLLAVSGGQFLPAEPLIAGTILNAPALGAIIGSIVGLGGLLVLLYLVERAHAGLPVLNACVILGYLGGAIVAGVPITAALGV